MTKSNKFSPEVCERAARMVQEHRGDYPSLWAAIESIAPRLAACRHSLKSGLRGLRVGKLPPRTRAFTFNTTQT